MVVNASAYSSAFARVLRFNCEGPDLGWHRKGRVQRSRCKKPKMFHSAQKFPSIKDYTNIVHYKKLDYSLFPFVQIPTYISPFAICTSQLQKVFAIFKKLGTEK